MERFVAEIRDWYSSRRLQLNADKIEVIWFGSRANIKKILTMDTTLKIWSTIVQPVASVRNLGVYMDSELTMRVHIGKVSSAFVQSRIDYCNSVFAGLPDITLLSLRRATNAAVRLVAGLGPRDPVTAAMRELHWPIGFRLKYKLSTVAYCSERFLSRIHLCTILIPVSVLPLRFSTSAHLMFCALERNSEIELFSGWTCGMKQSTSIAYTYYDIVQFKRALNAHFYSVVYNI